MLYAISTQALQHPWLPLQERARQVVNVGGQVSTFVQDARLRWTNAFVDEPDRAMYVMKSRIMGMGGHMRENGPQVATQLWHTEGGR